MLCILKTRPLLFNRPIILRIRNFFAIKMCNTALLVIWIVSLKVMIPFIIYNNKKFVGATPWKYLITSVKKKLTGKSLVSFYGNIISILLVLMSIRLQKCSCLWFLGPTVNLSKLIIPVFRFVCPSVAFFLFRMNFVVAYR